MGTPLCSNTTWKRVERQTERPNGEGKKQYCKKTKTRSISDYFEELRQNEGRKDGRQRNLEIKSRSLVMWWNYSNVLLKPDPSLSHYVLQLLPGIQLFFSSLLSANTCHLLFPGWHFINWQNNFLANVKYPKEWGKTNGGYWDLVIYCVLSAFFPHLIKTELISYPVPPCLVDSNHGMIIYINCSLLLQLMAAWVLQIAIQSAHI